MSAADVERIAIRESFKDIRKWIDKLAWNAHKQLGLDLEEARAEAYYHFVNSYWKHDAERGQLTTYLGYLIRDRLKDLALKGRKRWRCVVYFHEIGTQREEDGTFITDQAYCKEEPIEYRLSELSDQARFVLQLLDDTGIDLKNPTKTRRALRNELKETHNWTVRKIHTTFLEIRRALQ